MRIPKELSIKGKKWSVIFKRRIVHDGAPCDGLCDFATRTIYLAYGLKEEKSKIFLHEYVHAVIYEYGFYVSSLSKDIEELICQTLATELSEKFRFRWKKII